MEEVDEAESVHQVYIACLMHGHRQAYPVELKVGISYYDCLICGLHVLELWEDECGSLLAFPILHYESSRLCLSIYASTKSEESLSAALQQNDGANEVRSVKLIKSSIFSYEQAWHRCIKQTNMSRKWLLKLPYDLSLHNRHPWPPLIIISQCMLPERSVTLKLQLFIHSLFYNNNNLPSVFYVEVLICIHLTKIFVGSHLSQLDKFKYFTMSVLRPDNKSEELEENLYFYIELLISLCDTLKSLRDISKLDEPRQIYDGLPEFLEVLLIPAINCFLSLAVQPDQLSIKLQVALIVFFFAHIGSFVLADAAKVGLADRLGYAIPFLFIFNHYNLEIVFTNTVDHH
ncbi:hypothetical protein R6Q59_000107 [Mikania micrantha]